MTTASGRKIPNTTKGVEGTVGLRYSGLSEFVKLSTLYQRHVISYLIGAVPWDLEELTISHSTSSIILFPCFLFLLTSLLTNEHSTLRHE